MNSKAVLCLLLVIALFAHGRAESFHELEDQALAEVTEALNQDLVDGHPLENIGESPLSLIETLVGAEAQTGSMLETQAETEVEAETEAEAEAEVEAEAETEAARDHGIYDHFFDDEERPYRRRHHRPRNTTRGPLNGTLPAPTPSISRPSVASGGNSTFDAEKLAKRKALGGNFRRNVTSWENRRRYSYTDADLDHVDEVNESDADPEGELERILSQPDLEIYESDEDKGVYFGPTKKDARFRYLKLRKSLRNSRKEARERRKLREAAILQAKYPAGTNVTLPKNGTTAAAPTKPVV